MRLRWPVWGGRAAHRTRPRVAQAIRAAEAAQVASGAEARTPWGAMSLAAGAGGHTYATAGLSPSLLWATARAARDAGRQPADVWAEALQHWLAEREPADDESEGRTMRVALDARRALAWRTIDATLGELRAG